VNDTLSACICTHISWNATP